MNNTNIPISTTPMKRLMFIMLDHNKLFIITLFYSLPKENDSSVIQTTSDKFRLNCIVNYWQQSLYMHSTFNKIK